MIYKLFNESKLGKFFGLVKNGIAKFSDIW